jgi:hypothetical protein
VIYLSGCVTQTMLAHPRPDLGVMLQPGMGNAIPFAWLPWAADNGCYAQGERFDAGEWLAWLGSLRPHRGTCLFATAPDVVGDWSPSWARSQLYLPTIQQLGFRPALVAQDGMPLRALDLGGFDVLFIGGTDEFKLSEDAYELAAKAHRQGRWVHMGRVNSLRRLTACRVSLIDSADGTFVKFGPDRNLPQVYDWLDTLQQQSVLTPPRVELPRVPLGHPALRRGGQR